MVNVLEVPSIRRQVAPISVEGYHRMGEMGLVDKRAELIRGVIVEKMSKSPLHESLVHRLFWILANAVVGMPYQVGKERPLTLSDSEPEPDVSVVEGKESDFLRRHPTDARLVVEVAVSSLELDREKTSIYAEAGVAEYWLVIAEQHMVEVFRNPVDGAYRDLQTLGLTDVIRCQSLPQIEVSMAELFQDL